MGNCLSASLLFCARKAKLERGPIQTHVRGEILRDARGRLRIGRIEVEIDPALSDSDRGRAWRCLELFEDYCVVTQSVREGIDVHVCVLGIDGKESKS